MLLPWKIKTQLPWEQVLFLKFTTKEYCSQLRNKLYSFGSTFHDLSRSGLFVTIPNLSDHNLVMKKLTLLFEGVQVETKQKWYFLSLSRMEFGS